MASSMAAHLPRSCVAFRGNPAAGMAPGRGAHCSPGLPQGERWSVRLVRSPAAVAGRLVAGMVLDSRFSCGVGKAALSPAARGVDMAGWVRRCGVRRPLRPRPIAVPRWSASAPSRSASSTPVAQLKPVAQLQPSVRE
jgi:hypothetical protein